MPALAYEALVFDVGGVIIPHDNAMLFRRLAARCAAPGAAERIRRRAGDPRYGTGEWPIAALHEECRATLGYDGDWPSFVADWCCHLSVDGAMLALVERLAATRRVMLFSNTNHEHWQHLLALTSGALGRFEAYLSHEIGRIKPSLAAFRDVADRAGITPARALHRRHGGECRGRAPRRLSCRALYRPGGARARAARKRLSRTTRRRRGTQVNFGVGWRPLFFALRSRYAPLLITEEDVGCPR